MSDRSSDGAADLERRRTLPSRGWRRPLHISIAAAATLYLSCCAAIATAQSVGNAAAESQPVESIVQSIDGGNPDLDPTTADHDDVEPGDYRFRVRASNDSGAWHTAGASLDLVVAPAYYHTVWFRVSCMAALLACLGALCCLRLRSLKRQFELRLDARVGERTRIARELHDTLLQNFQGVLLKFHAVTDMLADRPAEAGLLKEALDQAERAITEGREAVQGLRSSTIVANGLARQVGILAEQLSAHQTEPATASFQITVQGPSRDLIPLVRDEIYRVAREALLNAFQHARANRIDVEIRYERRQFRLWVRDDGRGIDATVLAEGGRVGHFGLPGMRERADLAGGRLVIRSKPGAGTAVELTVPAPRSYASTMRVRKSLFTRA